MISTTEELFYTPAHMFAGIFLVSAAALGGAYFSQYVWGLEPCILCLYQRIPYALTIGVGLAGMLVARGRDRLASALLLICSMAFLMNAGIALYHSGVERGWWESAVDGCAVDFGGEKNLLEKIMGTPSVPCTKIQWADPLIGLTMANYNGILSIVLSDLCLLAFMLRLRQKRSARP